MSVGASVMVRIMDERRKSANGRDKQEYKARSGLRVLPLPHEQEKKGENDEYLTVLDVYRR